MKKISHCDIFGPTLCIFWNDSWALACEENLSSLQERWEVWMEFHQPPVDMVNIKYPYYLQGFSTIQTVVGLGISSTARNWFRQPKNQSFSNLTTEVCNIFRRRETMWEMLENGCCVLLRWLWEKIFQALRLGVRFCCSQNRVKWLSFPEPVAFLVNCFGGRGHCRTDH